jgi:hypothetical protein
MDMNMTQQAASNDEIEMIKKVPMENLNSMDDVKNAAMMMKMGRPMWRRASNGEPSRRPRSGTEGGVGWVW